MTCITCNNNATLTQEGTCTLVNAAAYYGNMEMLKYLKLKGGNMKLKGPVSLLNFACCAPARVR